MGEDQPFMEILHEVLRNYGKSVLHGHTHIYQSMPRMLTIWFEYGNYCSANPAPSGNKACLSPLYRTGFVDAALPLDARMLLHAIQCHAWTCVAIAF